MLDRRSFLYLSGGAALNLVPLFGGEREQEVAKIKARAALAILGATKLPPATSVPTRLSTTRPIVYKYSAKWCGPCQQAKADLAAYNRSLPFDIVEWDVDIDANGYEGKIPAWSWRTAKGTDGYLGWYGVQDLITRWVASTSGQQAPAVADNSVTANDPGNDYPKMIGYNPSYDWPGSLKEHLRSFHRVGSTVDILTQDQLEALHDKLHGVRVRPY